jgi:phage/plasmid-like protein (TIGR03299 family)
MAHEIDTTTGQAAVFVTGEPAWHKLGKVVSQAQTSAQAIGLAGLDWQVEQWGLRAYKPGSPSDAPKDVDDKLANVRSDTKAVLGVVGTNYRPFQNREAFDFMDALVGERLAMFETAGSLKGGKHIWMLARIPREIRVAGNDTVRPYVLLTNSHDGTRTLRMIPTTVRVVCWNTLTLALNRARAQEGLAIVHTESLERRVAEARHKLGIIANRIDRFAEQAQTLAKRQLTTEQLRDYFTQLVAKRSERQQKKLMERFLDNFHNQRNALPEIRGSVWAAYNAVSEFADHEITVHGKDEWTRLDNRVNSMWFGSGNALKQEAFEAALALAI